MLRSHWVPVPGDVRDRARNTGWSWCQIPFWAMTGHRNGTWLLDQPHTSRTAGSVQLQCHQSPSACFPLTLTASAASAPPPQPGPSRFNSHSHRLVSFTTQLSPSLNCAQQVLAEGEKRARQLNEQRHCGSQGCQPHLPAPHTTSTETRSPSTTPKPYLWGRKDKNPKGSTFPPPTLHPGGRRQEGMQEPQQLHGAQPRGPIHPPKPSPPPKVRGLLISFDFSNGRSCK